MEVVISILEVRQVIQMINYYQLKQQLLKALSITKNRSGLVMVQRLVNKPGMKTFMQTFYIRPNQVQKTDRVIAGHNNLPETHSQRQPQVKFAKEIKQQTHQFFSQFSNSQDAYTALKKMGIAWEHTDSAGRNLLRAKQALNHALQSGFVIPPNQSATVTLSSSVPTKPSDQVEIPKDATPAQKNLAELINKMTDIEVIRKCAVMGVVPEDKVAEDFILHTLMDKLSDIIKYGRDLNGNTETYNSIPENISQQFYEDMISLGIDFPNPLSVRDSLKFLLNDSVPSVIEDAMNSLVGQVHTNPGNNFDIATDSFDMTYIIDPYYHFDPEKSKYPINKDCNQMLFDLNQLVFNTTSDSMKDGFVQILQRIKQDNSNDKEIIQAVDNKIQEYKNLLQLVPDSNHNKWETLKDMYEEGMKQLQANTLDPQGLSAQIIIAANHLFGNDTGFYSQTYTKRAGYIDQHDITEIYMNTSKHDTSRANKVIMANIILADKFIDVAKTTGASNSSFSFYVPNKNTRITPDIQAKITKQLDAIPLYSSKYIDEATQYYANSGKSSFDISRSEVLSKLSLWRNFHEFETHPLRPIVYKNLVALSSFTSNPPHIDYDTFGKPSQPLIRNFNLKDARQRLFDSAKLSLATESMKTSDKMRQDILQNKFDYKPGDMDILGHQYDTLLYDGNLNTGDDGDNCQRFALFNSRFFKINNSIWEERMNTEIQRLKQQYPDHPEYYEVNQGFHGTSYWSAANIIGRDGEFTIGRSNLTQNGLFFGPGVYMGDRLGKSITYIGNDPFSMLFEPDLKNDAADGIVMLMDYITGDKLYGPKVDFIDVHEKQNIPEDTTCVFGGPSNSIVKAAEIVIRDNNLLFPRYLVDVSGRSIANLDEDEIDEENDEEIFYGNIQRNRRGDFVDEKGNIQYTADGKSVNMK